ncbi:hypothetical protein, partial [Xenorhabdus santafensis]|uniref:hypothetical protein n=1 Tax=Xenorhabdus santafensis TaxID=2582833 RepID=UPI0029E802F4
CFFKEISGTKPPYPSKNIVIKGGQFNKVATHAVRLVNSINCSVENITGKDVLYEIVSFEYESGKHDRDGRTVIPNGNYCNNIKSINSRSCIILHHSGVYVGSNIYDKHGEYSVYNYENGYLQPHFLTKS